MHIEISSINDSCWSSFSALYGADESTVTGSTDVLLPTIPQKQIVKETWENIFKNILIKET